MPRRVRRSPSRSASTPRNPRRAEADLPFLRRRRAELRLHEGRPEAARATSASSAQPQEYFRAHSLLITGDGTPALKWGSTNAYTEDAQGKPIYDWTIVDRIFDAVPRRGVKPYVADRLHAEGALDQARALPARVAPRRFPTTTSTPAGPIRRRTTTKWGELVYQWVKHCVERYGARRSRAVVLGSLERAEHRLLEGHARRSSASSTTTRSTPCAARCPTARVGGPDTAGDGGKFMQEFLEHCLRGTNHATGKIGTPIDFLSFHAKGTTPTFRRRPRAHGDRRPAPHDRHGVQALRVVSRAEGQADRHRRIRSRRLRRLPGAAARLPQQHDVFELHGGVVSPASTCSPRSTA